TGTDGADAAGARPETAVERAVAAAFADVLGVDTVDVTASFFALGGDSIMSIQPASPLAAPGIVVRARDIFQRKTVRGLARVPASANPTELAELPGGGVGDIPATPILRWFAEHIGRADRFAQSVLVRLPGDARPADVTATVQALLDRHDALRARWHDDHLLVPPAGGIDAAEVIEVRTFGAGEEPGTDGFTALVESALRQASDRLDPAEGRMVDVVCLLPEPGVSAQGRSLIVIHHLVVDGVSWRILLPDLATAWQRITAG